ncbi:MAG: ABC transporter permease subunit [Nitrospirota bacterium]|jgi:phosphate transport system permease protein
MTSTTNPPHRRRTTRRHVLVVDRIARRAITAGGLMVIVAVLGILIYLIVVVAPLFRAPRTASPTTAPLGGGEAEQLLATSVDPFQELALALFADGTLSIFTLADGGLLATSSVVLPADVRAFQYHPAEDTAVFGLADGRVATAHLGFAVKLLPAETPPAGLAPLAPGESRPWQEGVVTRLPEGQYRITTAVATVDDLLAVDPAGRPITLVDLRRTADSITLVSLTDDGRLRLSNVTRRENFLTGEFRTEITDSDLPFMPRATPPRFLLVTGAADQCYVGWPDGNVQRFGLRNVDAGGPMEEVDLLPDPEVTLTGLTFLLGEQSLVATDDQGGVNVWFKVQPADRAAARGEDGHELVLAHRLAPQSAAITATAISSRDKGLVTGAADGSVWLRYATSERLLARLQGDGPVQALAIAPKGDGILATSRDGRVRHWRIDNPHPQVTLKALFMPVWYEGYPGPAHVWQSSSGSDDFEPKLGLVPLIFGTIKATLFAMGMAVPVALLAAIYTAEFLHPTTRAVVKPVIEMMASLPSVVLGFIAALVMAPVVENWVVSCLLIFAVVPLVALACGYLWQALPRAIQVRLSSNGRLALVTVAILASCWLVPKIGPEVERLVFGGDFRAWLEQRTGSGTPLWLVILWPLVALAALPAKRGGTRALAGRLGNRGGLVELIAAIVYIAGTLVTATVASMALTAIGWDPRGPLVGTYVQRNTFIVGFVMGFAVIPIIYTIAEEALSAVPAHLRSASLACGATPWQTAVRVVLPTAASGILGAAMVGLGRAVGETMIVVMAAGNTPLLDINPFNGLRALSANIAVELPEAVRDSTLYRMLFLAALILFAMTFVINTVAEVVRLRFRRRAFQL